MGPAVSLGAPETCIYTSVFIALTMAGDHRDRFGLSHYLNGTGGCKDDL